MKSIGTFKGCFNFITKQTEQYNRLFSKSSYTRNKIPTTILQSALGLIQL